MGTGVSASISVRRAPHCDIEPVFHFRRDQEPESGALCIQPGQSNLGLDAQEEQADEHLMLLVPATPPPVMPASARELSRLIANFRGLSPQQLSGLPAISQGAPASVCTQAKGIASGGIASFVTSFMFGKLANNALSLAHPVAGAIAYAVVAGGLNALFSEPLAAAVRGNYGNYASPDGTAWSNYITALGRLNIAFGCGTQEEIAQCNADLDGVVDKLLDRMQEAAEKGTPLWMPPGLSDFPILAAGLRAFFTDQLPIFWFTATYMGSGAAAPCLRAALGGADLGDRATAATADFLAATLAGLIAGTLTVGCQNMLRALVQHAPHPREGIHSPEQREAHKKRMRTAIGVLQANEIQLDAIAKFIDAKATITPLQAQQLHAEIRQASETNQHALTKHARNLGRLGSIHGRNSISTDHNLAAILAGKAKADPAFLNGGPIQRRTAAKFLGNTVALWPAVLHMVYLSTLASQVLPFDHLGGNDEQVNMHFNSTQAQDAFIEEGLEAMMLPSMMVGATVIAAWVTSFIFWTPVFELLLSDFELMRRRAVNAWSGHEARGELEPSASDSHTPDIEQA